MSLVQGPLPCVILSHSHHTVFLKTLKQMPNRVYGKHVQSEEEGDAAQQAAQAGITPTVSRGRGGKDKRKGMRQGPSCRARRGQAATVDQKEPATA